MFLLDLLSQNIFLPYSTIPLTILKVSIRSPRILLSPRVVNFILASRSLYGNRPMFDFSDFEFIYLYLMLIVLNKSWIKLIFVFIFY